MNRPLFAHANLRLKSCKHGPMMYLANDSYIGRSLDLYGEFSEGECRLFDQIVRPGMVVVDVGANIGAHTVQLAKSVGPSGKVLAFEPQRILYQMLCGNVALNLLANVATFNAALAAKHGVVRVPPIDYGQVANFGGLSLAATRDGEAIAARSLDSYSLRSCHFIKIDVEGMERDVLEGACKTLATRRPILYVENDRAGQSKELIAWIMANGYRAYWHLPSLFNPNNYFGNPEDVFGNIVSAQLLCIPTESSMAISGSREVTSADDTWPLAAGAR